MNLTMGLRRAAALDGSAEALVGENVRFDRNEFVERVARLAGALQNLGMKPGDRVAMLAANGPGYIEFYFGVLWGGGIIVPINSRFVLAEMIEQTRDAEPVILIVDQNFSEIGIAVMEGSPSIRVLLANGHTSASRRAQDYEHTVAAADAVDDAMRSGDDLACLFYTGGTMGRTKGVMLSHGNLWANAITTTAHCGFDESLVHLHAGPLFHLGAGGRVYTTALVGGKHVVIPRFTPQLALEAIAREKVTCATFVPTMLAMMLELPDFNRYDLSSLRMITYGASPMPKAVLDQCLRRLPQIGFAQSYGMTELSPVATMLAPADHAKDAPRHRLRSAGRPVFSAEVRVVDGDDRPLPQGEIGEIIVRGPMVMQGYWRKPELSAETLRNGWMHTGDSGYFDEDGFLYVADRIKDMIITGGENVYSIEVENAISVHPDVLQCAVIGIPDPRWGERVHAIVVPRTGAQPTQDDIIAHCHTVIAGYKCPRSVDVRAEPLPLSSINKIDKAALRAAINNNAASG